MSSKQFAILLLFILYSISPVSARTIRLKAYKSLQRQMLYENTTYVISNTFDLKGQSLHIPTGCILQFKKGRIENGIVEGSMTRVIADKYLIFKSIRLNGSWENDTVYSEWIDFIQEDQFDNREKFQNLMTLCNGECYTQVFMQEGEYWTSVRNNGYGIKISSNIYFHSKAVIKELPNDYQVACLINIYKADNVTIDGGIYIGDLNIHIGEKGEWSHGIECRASSNVSIKNVICKEFWGDGIDVIEGYDANQKPTLNCRNITIENAKCYYNRRTGIGIEAVTGCKVKNCECRYTGQKRGTLPMAGLSIEAWSRENEKIKNIEIIDCIFMDNKETDLISYANGPLKEDFAVYSNNILIKNCTIGYFFVSHTNGIILDNCKIEKSKGYEHKYVKGLQYKNCMLKEKPLNKTITNLPKKK